MSVRKYGSERDWLSDHSSLPTGSVQSEQDGFGRNSDGPSSCWDKPYCVVDNPSLTPARTRSREEFEENRHVSAMNWSVCPVLTDTGQFYEMGSRQTRECGMQYKEESSTSHLEKLSQFCESLSRGKSTLSSKFQWYNLLEATEESSNANGNRKMDIPGSSLVPQVPISMGNNVGPVKFFGGYRVGPTTVRNGNHEAVIGGGTGGSVIPMVKQIFGEGRDKVFLPKEEKGFGLRARTRTVDSLVDMIEGNDGRFADVRKAYAGSSVATMPVESPRENMSRFVREKSSNVDIIQGNGDMVRVRDGVGARTSIVDSIVDMIDGSVSDLGKANVGSTVVTMPVESHREETRRFVREKSSNVDMIEGNEDMVRVRDEVKEYRVFDNHGYFDVKQDVNLVERQYYGEDDDGLDCKSDHLKYQREVALDPVNLKLVEDSSFERECTGLDGGGAYEDSFSSLPVSYDELYANVTNPQRLSAAEDQGIPETSEMVLKRKRSIGLEMSRRECKKHALFSDQNDFNEINGLSYGDLKWTNQHAEQFSSSETLALKHSKREGAGYMIDGNAYSSNPFSSPDMPTLKQMHSTKPVTPSRTVTRQGFLPKGNVKQRLGFATNAQASVRSAKKVKQRLELAKSPTKSLTPTQNVKQRLGYVTDAGKRSKAGHNVTQKKLPWIKRFEVRSTVADLDGILNPHVVESLQTKKNKKHLEATVREDSDVFMQQVEKSFLKFVKLLNENGAQLSKYMEPKGDLALKCGICGSDSKEFVETLSLVQHASVACKNGSRTEHLGLHKALCVLMGWKNTVDPDRMWVRELLPLTEALSQKEDLIIWPPIVIIHNSSMSSNNPDERIVVGVEDLRDLIRAMGFGQGMTNLCLGNAANLSTMVVNFKGTFSGLWEAERLHMRYSVSKHGRAEFQQVSSSSQKRIPADSPESVLYGYLGTAWDLDKLDFTTKKRSVVKSKKAIKAIADASFDAE